MTQLLLSVSLVRSPHTASFLQGSGALINQPCVTIHLTNIIYVNHDVEEVSSLTLSLSVPCELIVEETQWLMKAFLNS